MALLIAGVLAWSLVHLFPGAAPIAREALLQRLGAGPYRGLFSLAVVAGIVLMVVGWRQAEPVPVYVPLLRGGTMTSALVFAAFVLFVAPYVPTNLKRWLRHPQLGGVVLWAAAHLLANGDSRSLVLFGGLGTWAVIEMLLVNRREGARLPPAAVPLSRDLVPLAIGTAAYALLFWLHPVLFGVQPGPG